jgi:hypothetical protein
MPLLTTEQKLDAANRLARTMASSFNRCVHHRQVAFNRNNLRWIHGVLVIAVLHTGDRFLVHGRVLDSAAVAYSRTNAFFTFFDAAPHTKGFDAEIQNTEQLKDVRRERKKLFAIQLYRERERCLAPPSGDAP